MSDDDRTYNPLDDLPADYVQGGVFQRLADLVRVRDLVTPFAAEYFEDDTPGEVVAALTQHGQLGCPVLVNGVQGLIGVFFSDSIDEPDFYDDDESLASWIDAEGQVPRYLSADTTLFEALELLENPGHWFVVVDGNRFTGVFQYSDVMKLPARMCLFGMTLEFESVALALCGQFAKECWQALPEQRRNGANETFDRRCRNRIVELTEKAVRSGQTSFELLLDCTTLADKGTAIRKCKLTAESHTRIKQVFNRIERLRNACAHPGIVDDAIPLEFHELKELTHDCHDLMDSFRRATPKSKPPTAESNDD